MAAKKIKLPSLEDLANAGAHYGHRTRRWHPKMEEYIYGSRDGIHIIDLEKTLVQLEKATQFLAKETQKGITILLVGTKRQAATVVKKISDEHHLHYITQRWPGGLLTNFSSLKSTIKRYEETVKTANSERELEKLSTKEKFQVLKQRDRLEKIVGGLVGLEKEPDLVIMVDPRREKTAIAETKQTHTPTIGIIDTNTDPGLVDYPIPCNDDTVGSVEIVLETLVKSITTKSSTPKNNSD